jgi:exocyst complex component 2
MTTEQTILSHYKVNTLFPTAWPPEKDADDSSEDESVSRLPPTRNRMSKSRYSVLERNASGRATVPGAERTKDGRDNLVQKDESDPLGMSRSVMQVLKQRGLPVEDDQKLRNRFLLSSTTFSPSLFLSQVHNNASTESLLQGLDFLSRSIEQKSASLKVLVESNFERFVRAKATIDNVYTEMRNQGLELDQAQQGQAKGRHSRHASKNSGHFRRMSGSTSALTPLDVGTPKTTEKRKNALIKEMEYGIQPIKAPLLELSVKAEEVWGPALGGKDKEDTLKAVLSVMERHKGIFEAGSNISDCIRRRDHNALVEEYVKAQKYANDARNLVDTAVQTRQPLSDPDIHQIVVTSRMWSDVDEQISNFKRDVWRRLAGTHFTKHPDAEENKPEEHMELISILLELGTEDNPIWVWLLSRYDFLKSKISNTVDRLKVEIEILRRRLANSEKPPVKQLLTYLRAAGQDGRVNPNEPIDSAKIIEVWEQIYSSLNALLSSQGGILGEVVEFWDTAQSFIDGRAQKSLPVGVDGSGRKHHRLSSDGVKDLKGGALELISMIRESVGSFFADAPIEDLSMLLSPISPTPETPRTPLSAGLSPETRFRFDPNNLPPPSPRNGEFWDKYAFWPPHANSLSGSYYLAKILTLIGTAASDMASLGVMRSQSRHEEMRVLVASCRERCATAICAAWQADSENSKALEDWTRQAERHDVTNMPSRFMTFEGFILANLQKSMFVSEAKRRPDLQDVILPPSTKLLNVMRTQFFSSIYKILSGMVSLAEKVSEVDVADGDDELSPTTNDASLTDPAGSIDSSNKSVRILVILSNIQSIRNELIPHLLTAFEAAFSITIPEETAKIRDVLGQIDARLFEAYTRPVAEKLDTVVKAGIGSPDWVPQTPRPIDAKPYVYETLLTLVLVHTEVSTTAAPLTAPILKHLLECLSISLMGAFTSPARQHYSLGALMQATLDVEFLAQTLNNYTTDKASEVQSQIYVTLDDRTDMAARAGLQEALQEMRAILKQLRERTKTEYLCFKRQRVQRGERPMSRAGAESRAS